VSSWLRMFWSWYQCQCRSFQGFCVGIGGVKVLSLGVEVSGVSSIIKVSRFRFIRVSKFCGISVSWCQGVGVRCRDTGAFVGESTLLLDFETFRQNI
jgi:hypothetical protein